MYQCSNKTNDFFRKYNLLPESIDLLAGCQTFQREMKNGLKNYCGTLKMLCTYIGTDREILAGEPVIAMDAGGTNFRVAVVTFDSNGKPLIDDLVTYSMPGTSGEISRDEFYASIVNYLTPVIHRSNKIGFCFSFPTEVTPERDGLLLGFTKEVKVRGMDNELICAGLKQALKDSGVVEEKSIIILNDTVATLLGGKAACPGRVFDSFIGFILGTGTNTCYIEKNMKILKNPDITGQPGSTIINIEAGGYGHFVRSEFDRRLDEMTADPGNQQFEKMVSGVYIGRVILEALHQAATDGLLSDGCAERVKGLRALSPREIDEFCYYPYSNTNPLGYCLTDNSQTEDDRMTIYCIIDTVFERAARMVMINLAAVIQQSEKGTNPCAPVLIAAEGTTFYKAKLFRNKLEHYVRTFLNEQLGLYCEFSKVESATLIGTALAGLWG